MIRMFVNRKEELEFLEGEHRRDSYSFIVVYGRRRVGKTELIKEFIKGKKHIYFLASQEPTAIQLQRLVLKVSRDLGERPPQILDWMDAMDYIGEMLKKEKTVLIIDEFPYLVESNKAIPSFFQNMIDEKLKKSGSMLILSGSSIGIMESKVLGHKSPLYGRRTGQIDLKPFDFEEAGLMIKKGIKERIEANAIFGGIPMYLNFFDNKRGLEENILQNIMNKNSFLHKEPELILKQEFREPGKYMAIMTAIANGNRHLGLISNATGIPSGTLPKYFDNLIMVRLIGREICVTEREKRSKKSLYYIMDGLFNFWFRFIEPNLSDIETSPEKFLRKVVMPEMPIFVSGTFEDVCREFVRKKLDYGIVGRWWYKGMEIDIVGLNKKENRIIFAECKWKENVDAEKVLEALRKKAKDVRWGGSKRQEEYVIFARSFSKKLKNTFDLKDLKRLKFN